MDTQREAVKLNPCPFCDSDDLYTDHALGKRQVLCSGCEASGPTEETDEEAIAGWNRAALASASAEPIYQIRPSGTVWFDRSKESYDECVAEGYESRIVYAAPLTRVAATVPPTDKEILGAADRHAVIKPAGLIRLVREMFAAAPAIEAATVPHGFALVPVEPTQAMLDAGYWPCTQGRGAKSVWGEMLAAAPASTADDSQTVADDTGAKS